MKAFAILTIAFALFSAGRPGTNCSPYFQYDAIDHYSIEITAQRHAEIVRKGRSADEHRLVQLLYESNARSLSDTALLRDLPSLGYRKTRLPSSSFADVNATFCKNNADTVAMDGPTYCIPVYRDVFVFRKDATTVGFARVCFDCSQYVLVWGQQEKESTYINGKSLTRLKEALEK